MYYIYALFREQHLFSELIALVGDEHNAFIIYVVTAECDGDFLKLRVS